MRPNVLLLVVDSLRADRCWGAGRTCRTPILDDLRSRSTVFTKAFSVASMTNICVSSICTGTYPFVHGVRSLAQGDLRRDLTTLAEAFKVYGYHTWAEVTGPLEARKGFNRGYDDYRYRHYTEWLDTPFGTYMGDKLRGDLPTPWFGYLHLWEMHNPRRVTPEYHSPDYGQSLYDRAMSSLDNQLARLLDALPENTIIILTGDHGEYLPRSASGGIVIRLKRPIDWLKRRAPGIENLRRHAKLALFGAMARFGRRDSEIYRIWVGHGFHVYDPLVHIPIFMYGSGFLPGGLEISHLVSHVDIFPTLVAACDLQLTNTALVNGVDLMSSIREYSRTSDNRSIYLEASGEHWNPRPEQWLVGLRTARYKFVRGLFNAKLTEELYDMEQDPAECENMVSKLPDVAAAMQARLEAVMQAAPEPVLETEPTYSPEEMAQIHQRLRDLGYTE
jgi:arylsulfatase A-like enzyme